MEEKFDYDIVDKPKRKPSIEAKATITDIKLKAGEVYKQAARDPEQLVYAIYANVDGWEGRIGTINKPPSRRISPATKLAQFRQRYKQFPKVGMKVDVVTNEKGYWLLESCKGVLSNRGFIAVCARHLYHTQKSIVQILVPRTMDGTRTTMLVLA